MAVVEPAAWLAEVGTASQSVEQVAARAAMARARRAVVVLRDGTA